MMSVSSIIPFNIHATRARTNRNFGLSAVDELALPSPQQVLNIQQANFEGLCPTTFAQYNQFAGQGKTLEGA